MKKPKPDENFSGNFKNNPFKPLKGFTPKTDPVGKKTCNAPLRDDRDEDDESLFLRTVEGARRIGPTHGATGAAIKHKAAVQADLGGQEEKRLFLQAMRKIGTSVRDELSEPESEEPERRSSTSRMRQLKRGTIKISAELDLHGFFKDEALIRLERFIASAFGRGLKAVLVITGKGINSPEGPVLQGAIAAWLRDKGKGLVAEFAPAPRDMGGSGAFVVFLKK